MPIINTRTMTIPQYRKIYDKLKSSTFEVPLIQRGYAWEDEQIRDLYEDILYIMQNDLDYFEDNQELNIALGQGILLQSDDGNYLIYDGQQRILTYILFCVSLAKQLHKFLSENEENERIKKRISKLEEIYLIDVKHNDEIHEKISRIKVSKKDENAFNYIIGLNNRMDKKSLSKLIPAYKMINHWIKDLPYNDLNKMFSILTTKIEMMFFESTNDNDAEELFYSTNSAGKPLCVNELLHARVFQLFKNNRQLTNNWKDIYDKLCQKEKEDRIDSLLLYSVQVDEFTMTSGKLFSYMNKKMKEEYGVIYLDKIISRLNILYDFLHGNVSEYNYIKTIIDITAIKQVFPLFLALNEKYNSDINKVVDNTQKILIYIILMNNVIKQSPGKTKHGLETILGNIKNNSNIDMFDRITKESDLFGKLTDLDNYFDNKTGKALFILCAIRNNRSFNAFQISNKGTTLEHIVPQNQDKWIEENELWKKEFEDNGNRIIYSLGNFTLLSEKINKSISNNVWTIKKQRIKTNGMAGIFSTIFDDNLLDCDEITPNYIVVRGEKIAKVLIDEVFSDFIKQN